MHLVCGFFILLLTGGVQSHSAFDGAPDVKYYEANCEQGDSTPKACWEKFCKQKNDCAVTFSKSQGHCCKVILSALIIHWSSNCSKCSKQLLQKKGDYKTLIATTGHKIPPPPVLWLYDKVSKGTNLGSVACFLNIDVNDFHFKALGPQGSSDMEYAWKKSTTRLNFIRLPKPRHVTFNKNKLFLNFSMAFTIGLWLKTDNTTPMVFIEMDNTNSGFFNAGLDFGFYPKTDQLQVSPSSQPKKPFLRTEPNTEGLNDWRHIAIIYTGRGTPTFYINGNPWSLKITSEVPFEALETLYMWGCNPKCAFQGAIACTTIFDKPLSLSDLRTVMRNCP